MVRITPDNVNELQSKLLNWYKKNGRKFPWRKSKLTHYQIIIAETLLQRTKAETVSNFFTNFITDFPNWDSLLIIDNPTLEHYLRPIGLYRQRAKRLRLLASEMVKRKGKIPLERKELESIPFLGQYIANAIELIIFKRASPLLDVNMARLLERYFGERRMADIRYDPYLQKLSFKVVNHPKTKEINWAILDYAALVCKARKPLFSECVLSNKCKFYLEFMSKPRLKIIEKLAR